MCATKTSVQEQLLSFHCSEDWIQALCRVPSPTLSDPAGLLLFCFWLWILESGFLYIFLAGLELTVWSRSLELAETPLPLDGGGSIATRDALRRSFYFGFGLFIFKFFFISMSIITWINITTHMPLTWRNITRSTIKQGSRGIRYRDPWQHSNGALHKDGAARAYINTLEGSS